MKFEATDPVSNLSGTTHIIVLDDITNTPEINNILKGASRIIANIICDQKIHRTSIVFLSVEPYFIKEAKKADESVRAVEKVIRRSGKNLI